MILAPDRILRKVEDGLLQRERSILVLMSKNVGCEAGSEMMGMAEDTFRRKRNLLKTWGEYLLLYDGNEELVGRELDRIFGKNGKKHSKVSSKALSYLRLVLLYPLLPVKIVAARANTSPSSFCNVVRYGLKKMEACPDCDKRVLEVIKKLRSILYGRRRGRVGTKQEA